ncbi:MAG: alpha-galactosidase [Solobacterium sp.]|nr:alpha-galactosidase [Solobacterium sp.]
MTIIFHKNSRVFHLTNGKISYIMRVMENEQLESIYFGKCLNDRDGFEYQHEAVSRSHAAIALPEPSVLSMQYTAQEYPFAGTGDYRSPACTVLQENGSRISNFRYVSFDIELGKPLPEGLPATYCEESEEAETLIIHLKDDISETELHLFYTIFRDHPAIARHAEFVQNGSQAVYLERALSACVEFKDCDFEMLQLSGAWARERYIRKRPLEYGMQAVSSMTGTASSAEENPFIALKRKETTENQGEVWGFSLIYSGNFLAAAEVSTFDMTRVLIGINPESFTWKLMQGNTFATPEAVMVYSDQGLGTMSRVYHKLYRSRLVRGYWRDRPRPILLNNWEGTYFDFNEQKILSMALDARNLGVELFVLDDGWFGRRNTDRDSLGDWYCNRNKIPSGIDGLAEKIEAMGIRFGLWIEPEMVNEDSDFYRAHPDWVIHVPERYRSHSRHQYVLDFSRKEVVDCIHGIIRKILSEAKISYIKWDMNRYMTEPYSIALPADRQGEMMHRYILGVYDLYEKLTGEFPEILFESCASGGARFDPGMLYYAPQAWCSDDTDAWERCKIQYGTSMVYPLSAIGSHVSTVPNHQLARVTPLRTRANIAYFGTFGYELVIGNMSAEEKDAVRRQIAFMKKYRELIQTGSDLYRLRSPFEHNEAEWIVVSKDRKKALALFCQKSNRVNGSWLRMKLDGLEPSFMYRVFAFIDEGPREFTAYGDELMKIGIAIDRVDLTVMGGDYVSILYEIEAVSCADATPAQI